MMLTIININDSVRIRYKTNGVVVVVGWLLVDGCFRWLLLLLCLFVASRAPSWALVSGAFA